MFLAACQGRFPGTGCLHYSDLVQKFHYGRDLSLVSSNLERVKIGAHIHYLSPENIDNPKHLGPRRLFGPDLDKGHFAVYELSLRKIIHFDYVNELVQLLDYLRQHAFVARGNERNPRQSLLVCLRRCNCFNVVPPAAEKSHYSRQDTRNILDQNAYRMPFIARDYHPEKLHSKSPI